MFITEGPIVADAVEFAPDSQNGAVVSFTGVVRSHDGGRRVTGIYYDCYRAIAEREVAAMVKDIRATFGVDSISACHRIGEVGAGEIALLVVVSAAHRREAFDACQAVIDRIKTRVPIWKKQRYADATAKWLAESPLRTNPEH